MSEKLIGACIFGQSGGPTAVINASAYGVISAALEAGEITKVYGASHGIKGVLDDKLYVMDEEDPTSVEGQAKIEAAKKALYTGHIGDGKIFVYNVDKVIKIRTGEENLAALADVE